MSVGGRDALRGYSKKIRLGIFRSLDAYRKNFVWKMKTASPKFKIYLLKKEKRSLNLVYGNCLLTCIVGIHDK